MLDTLLKIKPDVVAAIYPNQGHTANVIREEMGLHPYALGSVHTCRPYSEASDNGREARSSRSIHRVHD